MQTYKNKLKPRHNNRKQPSKETMLQLFRAEDTSRNPNHCQRRHGGARRKRGRSVRMGWKLRRPHAPHQDQQDRPPPQQQRTVHFAPQVRVHDIPSHRAYSDQEKTQIWSSSSSIRQQALLNQAEFIAEGRQWEAVVESTEMYLDAVSGKKIHPFWIENYA